MIADVTTHATDPRLLLSRHQQVVELEAIMVEIQADLADLAFQEKIHKDFGGKRNIRIIERK